MIQIQENRPHYEGVHLREGKGKKKHPREGKGMTEPFLSVLFVGSGYFFLLLVLVGNVICP